MHPWTQGIYLRGYVCETVPVARKKFKIAMTSLTWQCTSVERLALVVPQQGRSYIPI